MNTVTKIAINSLAALVLGASSWAAQASTVTWNFDYNITSGSATATVASLKLEDSAGGVLFTIANDPLNLQLLGSDTKLKYIWFKSSTSVAASDFSAPSTYGASLDLTPNGTQGYDFSLEVKLTATNATHLGNGMSTTWFIDNHSVSDFTTLATGSSNGPATNAMVQILNASNTPFNSVHYVSAVPEPHTYLLMGVGLGLMGLLVRRRMNG